MKRAVAMMVGAVIAGLLGVTASAGAATVQLFNVPSADSGLQHIVAGPDGALWFTERKAGQVGQITTSGQISEYPIPNNASGLADTGPDQIVSSGGAIWFLADIGESVYSIAPAASPSPTLVYQDQLNNAAGLGPSDNGGVWLMEAHGDGNDGDGDALVRVNPDGSAVDYPATHPNTLYAIALAPDGAGRCGSSTRAPTRSGGSPSTTRCSDPPPPRSRPRPRSRSAFRARAWAGSGATRRCRRAAT